MKKGEHGGRRSERFRLQDLLLSLVHDSSCGRAWAAALDQTLDCTALMYAPKTYETRDRVLCFVLYSLLNFVQLLS